MDNMDNIVICNAVSDWLDCDLDCMGVWDWLSPSSSKPLVTSEVFLNFERKIAAFQLVWDAETKHLIGCQRVVAAVYSLLA